MTAGVSHTFGGNVVVVDMHSGLRFDLSPAQAMAGADICETAANCGADHSIVTIPSVDGRKLRWDGKRADLVKMALDLRDHAKKAAARKAANDGGEAA